MVSSSGVSMHLCPVGAIPLHLECHFHWEIVFIWSRNTHFGKFEGIMLQWRICFIFLKISHILSVLLLDIYCFSLKMLPSLAAYALFHAPCVIAVNQKQKGKVFFSCLLGYVCSLPCTLCDHGKSETMRKLENVDFPGRLTKI